MHYVKTWIKKQKTYGTKSYPSKSYLQIEVINIIKLFPVFPINSNVAVAEKAIKNIGKTILI